jgi:hypothetical protein
MNRNNCANGGYFVIWFHVENSVYGTEAQEPGTELNQVLFLLVLQCSNARWIQYRNLPGREKLLWTPVTGFFHLAEPWHTRREEEDG